MLQNELKRARTCYILESCFEFLIIAHCNININILLLLIIILTAGNVREPAKTETPNMEHTPNEDKFDFKGGQFENVLLIVIFLVSQYE